MPSILQARRLWNCQEHAKNMKTRIKFLKTIVTIFVAIFITSCNNSQLCANSSNEAFELFKLNIQNKDLFKADKLFAIN
jgi:hypothetical protein